MLPLKTTQATFQSCTLLSRYGYPKITTTA